MGTKNFFVKPPRSFSSSGTNLQARAGAAGGYSSRASGVGAQKDIAAAQALYAHSRLQPNKKDAAVNAPGPRKV